ncbi:MAG: aconitase family protein [Planctomycetota bacterium]
MTLTEQIFAAHAGNTHVAPGDNVWVNVQTLMTHDVCGPGTIGIFKKEFGQNAKVWDNTRIPIIPDHYIFTADEKCHRNIQTLRDFVKEQDIKYYYDPDFINMNPGMPSPYKDPTKTNYKGVCHKALPEEGHCRPGEILLGTDSHTCTAGAFGQFATGVGNTDAAFTMGTGKTWLKVPPTMKFVFHGEIPPYLTAKDLILAVIGDIGFAGATYKAMYFTGDGISSLSLEDRMTLTNMAIEAGGKNGICDVDEKTLTYVRARSNRPDWTVFEEDAGASYCYTREWDLANFEPLVAAPHSPDNTKLARECSDVKLHRAYIGSCTGGKITDMIFAAAILYGKQVKIPSFVVPGSTEVHADMQRLNLYGLPLGQTPADASAQDDNLRSSGKSVSPVASDDRFNPNTSIEQALVDAGCMMGAASCAACLGGPSDTFGRLNEPLLCISTTNRNFPGRMGHKEAGVYLASPLTAAASALTGHVTDPREFVDAPILTGSAGVM